MWFGVVPLLTMGLVTTVLFAIGIIPLVYLWSSLIMWCLISGLGIAVGYHRIFSHKTHVIPTWKENIILFFATLSGQGSCIFWVALHRGYHHPHADTAKDYHSPVAYSRWQAFMGWINSDTFNVVNLKYAVDLLKKPNFVFFHKYCYEILWLTPAVIALYDWRLAMSMCFIPGMVGLLQDNAVNVFGHVKALIGYRNFDTRDHSQNNFVLGYLGWGQGWHNNHHARPANFDFGRGTSGRWWEFDPCVIFLPVLGRSRRD